MEQYKVRRVTEPVNWTVAVPGSKSMTNRALLMAALSDGRVQLDGVLFSDDSRYFISSLQSLGFEIEADEETKCVRIKGEGGHIPKKDATIYVGSAGTAARFLTAMLGMSDGVYEIQASEQMKRRPMEELFALLVQTGAKITYLEEPGHLPVRIVGRLSDVKQSRQEAGKLKVGLDISKSTQFLSAMLLIAPMVPEGLEIEITSEKTDGSYIRITRKMMENLGVCTGYNGKVYTVEANAHYRKEQYTVEPDMSAACYFYAAAAITGGTVTVRNVHMDNTQGDLKFLNVLKEIGCAVCEQEAGICVTGPADGQISGIDVDMNDFSDQTMTLAAIAPYASGPVHIRHIGHIRLQESDRIHAIVTELTRAGVQCEEEQDAICIYPGEVKPCAIQTYEDHRMAMAFSLLGLRTDGIVIENPSCCRKTFENYFEILTKLTERR